MLRVEMFGHVFVSNYWENMSIVCLDSIDYLAYGPLYKSLCVAFSSDTRLVFTSNVNSYLVSQILFPRSSAE